MKSWSLHSSAGDSLPEVAWGRAARLVFAGLLALGILAVLLIPRRAGAGAREDDKSIVQPVFAAGASALAQAVSGTDSYPNCRFGVGERYRPVMSYDVSALNLGWYVDWGTQTNPPRPGGAEYAQMLHVDGSSFSPSGSTLAARIAANPGALWLIGNEPDCIYQDNVPPQEYAQAYHDAYTFIKGHDSTAAVSAGGIVQPTPLRMQYLDIVLDTYSSLYGEPLPTDAWNIHTYILREASCTKYPNSCWGAEIPPGIAADAGMLYTLDDTDDLDIFQQRIEQFRQWMRGQGYRDTPLLITEYGTLLPYYDPDSLFYDSEGNPFDEERARDFMYGTFDFLLTANDPDMGYPADENRLVQRWLWYSLDDTVEYGGALFDRLTLDMMQLGADFGAYTGAISPTVDLFAVDVGQMAPVPYSPANAVTLTLRARVSNVGNVAITQPVTIRFLDGQGHQIGSDQVISETMAGCAALVEVTMAWPDVTPGAHAVHVVVDPEDVVTEGSEGNNEIYGVVLVAKEQVFLPLIARKR
jgi:hypothetical protein